MKHFKYLPLFICMLFCTTVFSQEVQKASISLSSGSSKLRGFDINGNGYVLGANYLTPISSRPIYLNIGLSANFQDASNILGPTYTIFHAFNAEPSVAYLLQIRPDIAIRFDLGFSVQQLNGKSDPSNFPLPSQSFSTWRYGGLTKIGMMIFPANKHFYVELCPISLRWMSDGYIDNEMTVSFGVPLKH